MGVVGDEQALAAERSRRDRRPGRPWRATPRRGPGPTSNAGPVDGVHAREARHLDARRARSAAGPRRRGRRRRRRRGRRASPSHVLVALPARHLGAQHGGAGRVVGASRGSCGARTGGRRGAPGRGGSGRRTRSTAAPVEHEADEDHRPVRAARPPVRRRRGASAATGMVDSDGGGVERPCRRRGRPAPVVVPRSTAATPAPTEPDRGAGGDRGVGDRLGDLAEAAPRVEERPTLGSGAAHEPPGDGRRATTPTPAGGRARRRARRVGVPELAGVRAVERVGDGRTEPGPHDLAEGVGPRTGAAGRDGVDGGAGGEPRRQVAHEVAGAQRERRPSGRPARMRPLRGRTWRSSPSRPRRSASSAGSVAGWRRWLPWSTRSAGDGPARRHAPDVVGPVDDGDLVPGPGGVPGRGEPRRPRPDDDDHGFRT